MKKVIIIGNEKKSDLNSKTPTILHEIIDKSMIKKVVDNFVTLGFDNITTVLDKDDSWIEQEVAGKCHLHRLDDEVTSFSSIKDLIEDEDGITVVTFANTPLITKKTYSKMVEEVEQYPMVVLTAKRDNVHNQDIILRNPDEKIRSIVKYEDATLDELSIRELNMNVYAFNNRLLYKYLNSESPLHSKRLVELFKADKHIVYPHQIEDAGESILIRNRHDLIKANAWDRNRIVSGWIDKGVTIVDLNSTIIGNDVVIGRDVIIHPNNTIIGKTEIGEDNVLLANNFINNTIVGKKNIIEQSKLEDVQIDENNVVGPWTNLRTGVRIGKDNKIGTNVELKNTVVENHVSISHNVYLGDTTVGSYCNIGWGVVTANFDGVNKNKTVIGDHSFIGSSSTIIAPVNIGSKVVVAAGSTINRDIADNDLAIARARQEIKENKGKEYLERVE